jgi:2-dehydropantoate 2-reductase
MRARRVGVLGPGAIGGLLAARLTKAGHEVTVIATERTAVAIELTGLKLRTPNEQDETRPIARPRLTAPVEVLLVTTKATDLPAALERTPPALLATSTIVPVMNGIDHLPLLRARYPKSRVVAASIYVEPSRPRTGRIDQHSIGL